MKHPNHTQAITLSTLVLMALSLTSNASTWYVAVDSPDGGDGVSWQTAFNTIQAGINAASDGDEVLVGDGTYTGDGNRDISFNGKAITVKSLNGPQKCLINCEGTEEENHRGFIFNSGEGENSILQGVTIFNGFQQYGGGIMLHASPSITQCVLSDNTATMRGGAIYCGVSSSSGVRNCILSSNAGDAGGALYLEQSASPVIINCTITDNKAGWSGAVLQSSSNDISASISNSIIWNNRSFTNTIFDVPDPETISIRYSTVEGGWQGEGNIDENPRLAFPASDLHLLPESPCINTGSNEHGNAAGDFDLDGNPRISDETIDMGVYEYNPSAHPTLAISTSSIRIIDPYGTKPADTPLLQVRNRTTGELVWTAHSDADWLILTPESGESTGEVDAIQLIVDPFGLSGGFYETEITIRNTADSSPLAVIAVDYFVGSNRTVKADGSGEFPTIQSAINASIHGDRITCEPGTYTGDGNWNIRFFGKGIHLKGKEGPEKTIIDCQHTQDKIPFYITDGETNDTIISGFTVTGASHEKGGIYCYNSDPSIYNCIIKGNRGGRGPVRPGIPQIGGSGISIDNASPQVVNTIISGNSSVSGGGISINRKSAPTLTHCAVVSNYAEDGGGVANYSQYKVTFNNCIIWENSTRYDYQQISEWSVADTVVNSSCIQGGWPGESNIDQDPKFIQPPDDGGDGWIDDDGTPGIDESLNNDYGDLRLRGDSPCIDTGNVTLLPSDWFDMDQNGISDEPLPWDLFMMPRFSGACPDMGPTEFSATPMLECSENPIRLFASIGRGATTRTIEIRNRGTGTIDWEATSWSDWLNISPTRGKILHDNATIMLTVNADEMAEGDYRTTLTFTSRRAMNSPLTIPVHLTVTPYRYRVEADGSGDFPTIQDAINAAVDGDLILCGDGTYTGTGNRNISFLGKRITLTSENGPENCIIDCQGHAYDLGRGFWFVNQETRNSILDGFTITNGFTNPIEFEPTDEHKGGAILCRDSSPTIRNCRFVHNIAYSGGAISNETASPLISNCYFEDNTGLGIVVDNNYESNPVIEECHFFRNSSRNFGPSYGVIRNIEGSHAIISKCLFELNSGCEGASGVADDNASSVISDCVFQASYTHCVYSGFSTTTITNCLFQSNISGYTSSVVTNNSTIQIANCTFADNPYINQYSRVLLLKTTDQGIPQPQISNCIFFNEQYPAGTSGISYDGSEPVITYSLLPGWPGEGNIDADPLFIRLPDDGGDGWMDDPDTDIDESANNDYGDLRLQPGSPCIDAGSNLLFPDDILTDLLGLPRFIDDPATTDTGQGTPPIIDMGAYEVQVPEKKRLIPQTNIQPAPASAVTNISIKKNIP